MKLPSVSPAFGARITLKGLATILGVHKNQTLDADRTYTPPGARRFRADLWAAAEKTGSSTLRLGNLSLQSRAEDVIFLTDVQPSQHHARFATFQALIGTALRLQQRLTETAPVDAAKVQRAITSIATMAAALTAGNPVDEDFTVDFTQ